MVKRAALCALLGGLVFWAGAAAAQQNDYGGYNIVGSLEASERNYGSARGWSVRSANDRGRFAYCVGAYNNNGLALRIGTDGKQWQLAVPGRSSPEWEGKLNVDGDSRFAAGTAVGNWTIAWLRLDELDRLAKGKHAELSNSTAYYSFPLTGTAATITKIEECLERKGNLTSAPLPPQTSAPSAPQSSKPSSLPGLGELKCFSKATGPYLCRVTDLPPEPGYHRISQIEPVEAPKLQSFYIKYGDGTAEVWTARSGDQSWAYLGVWGFGSANNCIAPVGYGAQTAEAQKNLDTRDWDICVQDH